MVDELPTASGLLLIGTCFLLAWGGIFVIFRWAPTVLPLDMPSARGMHSTPTRQGGGLVIAATVVGSASGAVLFGVQPVTGLGFGLCALSVALVGYIDDFCGLTIRMRLVAQGLAALTALYLFGVWEAEFLSNIVLLALSVAGVIYFTNMFNFMDGIDGIAGTQAAVAGLSWGLIGTLVGEQLPQIIGYSVCGASLGFLRYNWFPARVFMGDVGSTVLGFVFGTLSLAGGLRLRMVAVGFLVVWPFIADSLFTIARRAVRRENFLRPHKEHIYQRLIARGVDPRLVCLIYGGGAVAGALVALMII